MEETKLSVVEINRLNSAVADIDEQSTGWLDRFDVCCDRAGMSRMSVIKLMGDQMAEGSLKIDRARIVSSSNVIQPTQTKKEQPKKKIKK
jgi:hypothetical protein